MPEITNEKKEKPKGISIYYSSYSGGWYFIGLPYIAENFIPCSGNCGVMVDPRYVHIINKLKEAKLLDKDYPILCCRCFNGGIKNAS